MMRRMCVYGAELFVVFVTRGYVNRLWLLLFNLFIFVDKRVMMLPCGMYSDVVFLGVLIKVENVYQRGQAEQNH